MADDPRDWTRHVVVIGLDGLALRTVEQLHRAGSRVVVIAGVGQDEGVRRRSQLVEQWGVPIVHDSPRLPSVLRSAGLDGAQAVLVVLDDDLSSLEVTLQVRELRPDVRIACRLSNSAVGDAVTKLDITVLDVPSLAAPAVVEACLRRRDHVITLGGEQFVASTVRAKRDGTLREIYGDLAPLAVAHPRTREIDVCPSRDGEVHEGDLVTVVGTAKELVHAGLRDEDGLRSIGMTGRRYAGGQTSQVERSRAFGARTRTFLATVRSVADRGVRITLALLLLLVVVSTVVLRFGYDDTGHRLHWHSAVYFTVETIATVGFGDFSFARQSTGLQIFGIVLIALGTGLVSTTFAFLTNALVTRRVEQSLGRSTAQSMRGHVVLIGLGSVGLGVLDGLLAAGRQVVVVESDENNRYLAEARSRRVPIVIGDATQASTLHSVQVRYASAVAAMTSDDLVNIEVGLAARAELGDRFPRARVVLRVFDRQLARTVEQSFGFEFVRSTSTIAAPFFVSAAIGLDLLGTFEATGTVLLVGKLPIGQGLAGVAMGDLSQRTRVIAIDRGDGVLEHPPRRGTRFAAGDAAYLIGPWDELLAVLRRDQGAAEPGLG